MQTPEESKRLPVEIPHTRRRHTVVRAALALTAGSLMALGVLVFVIGARASAGTADSTNLYFVAVVLVAVAVALVWVGQQLARR